jgi:hypothetical protein
MTTTPATTGGAVPGPGSSGNVVTGSVAAVSVLTAEHKAFMGLVYGVALMYGLSIAGGKNPDVARVIKWFLIALWVVFGLNYTTKKLTGG